MIVGHNPSVSNAAYILGAKNAINMPTASVAIFESEAKQWIDILNSPITLIKFLTPKTIK